MNDNELIETHNKIIAELKRNNGVMEFGKLAQNIAIDPKRLDEILKGLARCDKIERRTSEQGSPNQLIVLKKSYRLYTKLISSIIITVLIIYLLGPNLRVLSLAGLTLGIVGAIFLAFGSLDNFMPIIDIKDDRPLKIGPKNIGLLFKKDYNDMSTMLGMLYVTYPALRLTTAELGPWLLLIGFILQFYAGYVDP